MKRSSKAFLLAPFVPFLFYMIYGLGFFTAACIVGLPIAYLVTLIWGIPLYAVIKKRPHLQRGYIYIFFAGMCGLLTGAIIFLFLGADSGDFTNAYISMLWGLLHGAGSGLVFWIIIRPTTQVSADLQKASSNA